MAFNQTRGLRVRLNWQNLQYWPASGQAALFMAMLPDVEKCPGYPKEAASLTDIAAHAQPGLQLPCMDLLLDLVLHPELPSVGFEDTSPVLDVY